MKLRNSILALGLVTSMGATADPISFDFTGYGITNFAGAPASDSVTDVFAQLNGPVNFQPVSTYMDTDNSGDINVGDAVTDVGSGVVILSQPGQVPTGTNGAWEIHFDYQLDGFLASIDGDGNYNAAFTSGFATMSLWDKQYDAALNPQPAIPLGTFATFNFIGADVADFDSAGNEVDLDLWFDATSIVAGDVFVNGKDANDLLTDGDSWTNFRLKIGVELSELDRAPTLVAGTTDTYTRVVDTSSPDLTFTAVSEPGTLAVFGLGLLGLAGAARRRKA